MRGGRQLAKPDVGRPLELGRCSGAVLMSLPSFCLADDEHNPTEFRGETCSRLTHADASDSPTDCPAQHGGAKRQQLTDVAAWPKRPVRGATPIRPHEIPQRVRTNRPEP